MPSLVSPVSSSVCGSTSRMYHRQVSSSPRLVSATISSSVAELPGGPSSTRLSMAGVTGSPDSPALCRVWISAASSPRWIQSVGARARPLSNTEESRCEACAITNGAQASPGRAGSLRSVSGSWASRSPTRVPPPGLLNTLRPSSASLAPADQYR